MTSDPNRFTLWDLNPNDVATFIVLVVLTLPVVLRWRHSVWYVLPIEAILGALLIGTGSRGGVLAAASGFLVAAITGWCYDRWPKHWQFWASVTMAILIGIGVGLFAFPKSFRLGSMDMAPEASAGRRLEVWSTVPAMLVAAPNGWGVGQSAEAYEEWFEPVGENVKLKHLLSSHLTWLVELGWPLRWMYLLFWITALVLLIPTRNFRFSVWGIAVWVAFAVALFYNAAGKWWNWPLPILWLFVAIILRCRNKAFPAYQYLLLSLALSGLLTALPFLVVKLRPPALPVIAEDGTNIVRLGLSKPSIAILEPSREVLGDFYGQNIRKGWKGEGGSVIIVREPDALAAAYLADCSLYVFSGGDGTSLEKWKSILGAKSVARLVLINCRTPVEDWMKGFKQVIFCHGEFYGDNHYEEWKNYVVNNPSVSMKVLAGQEAYVADWWPLLEEDSDK